MPITPPTGALTRLVGYPTRREARLARGERHPSSTPSRWRVLAWAGTYAAVLAGLVLAWHGAW